MKSLALVMWLPLAISTVCSIEDSRAAEGPAAGTGEARTSATAQGNPTSAVLAADTRGAAAAPQPTAKVSLVSAPGKSLKGDLTLDHEGLAVHLRGEITGLAPGEEHGLHFHEVGQCSPPDFSSAGEHLNPAKDPHGGPGSAARHLGDLPNAKADQNGRARIDVMVKGATLVDKDGGPNQLVGKALVVHAMRDDYKTQPSGDSGDRIACGVVRADRG
jgi:superoxide dismutase, Cu-Zn family